MRSEPSGFLPRSLSHLTLTLARRTPAVTNGRMLRRTPSSRSGSQPMGCSARRLPAHVDVVGRLAHDDRGEPLLEPEGGGEPRLGPGLVASGPLALDPVA